MVNDSINALKDQLQSEIEQLKAHHTDKNTALKSDIVSLNHTLRQELSDLKTKTAKETVAEKLRIDKAISDQNSALRAQLEQNIADQEEGQRARLAQLEQDIANRNKAQKAHFEAEMRKNKHALESKLVRKIEEKNSALKADLTSNLEAHIEKEFAVKDNQFCMQHGKNCTGKDFILNIRMKLRLIYAVSHYLFPADCVWDAWSQWDACSATCEGGTQQRSRSIGIEEAKGGAKCEGNNTESRPCNSDGCPGKSVR